MRVSIVSILRGLVTISILAGLAVGSVPGLLKNPPLSG